MYFGIVVFVILSVFSYRKSSYIATFEVVTIGDNRQIPPSLSTEGVATTAIRLSLFWEFTVIDRIGKIT